MRIFILVMLFLSGCLPEDTKRQYFAGEVIKYPFVAETVVCIEDYYTSGMHYKVLWSYKGGIQTINVTKDSLEVANMKSYETK